MFALPTPLDALTTNRDPLPTDQPAFSKIRGDIVNATYCIRDAGVAIV